MEHKRTGRMISNKYIRFFLPTVIMSLATSLALIVDSIIVSNMLGAEYMASVNVAMPLVQTYATFTGLFGVGAATLMSLSRGRGDQEKANKAFSWFVILVLAVGLLFFLLQFFLHQQLANILTGEETIRQYANSYITNLSYSIIPMMLTMGMAFIMQADGRPTLAAVMVIVSNVINLTFDVILMGPVKMGIGGSSLATAIGYACGLLLIIPYIFSKRRNVHFTFKLSFDVVWSIVKMGISVAFVYGLIAVKILVTNLIVGNVAGTDGLLSFSICMSALSLESIVVTGVSQTMLPLLGLFCCEKDNNGVKMLFKYSMIVLYSILIVFVLFLEIFPNAFLAMYGIKDSAIIVTSLRIYSIGLIPSAFVIVMVYYYTAVESTKVSFILSILEGFVLVVPVGYLMTLFMGLNGMWVGFIIGESLCVLLIVIIARGNLKNIFRIEEVPSIMELSLNKDEIHDVVESSVNHLKSLGVDDVMAVKIGISIEEYYVVNKKINDRDCNVDIVIKSFEENISISFIDNGVDFDPLTYKDEEEIGNIEMLKSLSDKLLYKRIAGLNLVHIELIRA